MIRYPEAYYDGRKARRDGYSRLSIKLSRLSPSGAWWLAGWHDMDMEL